MTQTRVGFVEQIAGARLWGPSDLVLVDVGASGGLHPRWAALGDRLAAVGFDPLIAEVERLNAVEARAKVRYEAARVGCRDYDVRFPPALRHDQLASRCNQPFHRSSAVAAHRIQQQDYVREVFNAGAEVVYTDRFVTLDEYFAASPLTPNFLKIDTDGSDFEVLLGAPDLLASGDLLGVEIEVQFHGAVHDYANSFSNIDRWLRDRGFSLFSLDSYRYSRAALPAPFAIGMPAQTVSGQVLWGEAVYFRDFGHATYDRMFGITPTPERLLKLCCLYAMYGLEDCAAELLATAPSLSDVPGRDALLDALTPGLFGDATYRAYMARWEADPSVWLPQNVRRAAPPAASERPAPGPDRRTHASRESGLPDEPLDATVQELRARVAALEKTRRRLRRRLEEQNAKIRRLRQERLAMKGRAPGPRPGAS